MRVKNCRSFTQFCKHGQPHSNNLFALSTACCCAVHKLMASSFEGEGAFSFLRRAWRDRVTNDIFAHCSLIIHSFDFKFSNFVCPFELHALVWFLKNSGKRKIIRKTAQNALAHGHLHSFVNRAETWYTASTYPSANTVLQRF